MIERGWYPVVSHCGAQKALVDLSREYPFSAHVVEFPRSAICTKISNIVTNFHSLKGHVILNHDKCFARGCYLSPTWQGTVGEQQVSVMAMVMYEKKMIHLLLAFHYFS